MSAFKSKTESGDGTCRVQLIGELDLAAYEEVDSLLAEIQVPGAQVELDLRPLTFMDSSGIRAVFRAQARATETAGRLALIRGSETVMRVLRVAGVEANLEFANPDHARS